MHQQGNSDDLDLFYRYDMEYGVSYGHKKSTYLLEIDMLCNMNLAFMNDTIDIYNVLTRKKYFTSRISEEMQMCIQIKQEDIGQELVMEISSKQYNSDSNLDSDCDSDSDSDSDLDSDNRGDVSFTIVFTIPDIAKSQPCLLCSVYVENSADLYVSKYGNTYHHSCITRM